MEDKKLTKWEDLKDYYEILREQENQIINIVDMLYTCLGEVSRFKENLRILEEDIKTALERQKKKSDNIRQKGWKLKQRMWEIEKSIISDLLGKDNNKALSFYDETLVFKQYIGRYIIKWAIKEHLEEVLKGTLKYLEKVNISENKDLLIWEIEKNIILALFKRDRKKALKFYEITEIFKKNVPRWSIEKGAIEDLIEEIDRIENPNDDPLEML
jgi:hypothetical protein